MIKDQNVNAVDKKNGFSALSYAAKYGILCIELQNS